MSCQAKGKGSITGQFHTFTGFTTFTGEVITGRGYSGKIKAKGRVGTMNGFRAPRMVLPKFCRKRPSI